MTIGNTQNYLKYNRLLISFENPEVKNQPIGVGTFAKQTIHSKTKNAKELPPLRPKNEFQNIFFNISKKYKTQHTADTQ